MPDTGPKFADRQGSETPQPPANHRTLYEMSVNAVRALDRAAVDDYAIPSIVLMENAALSVLPKALALLQQAPPHARRRVTVLCGPGNNGGDGLALARHLANERAQVRVALLAPADAYRGDAGINRAIIERMARDHHALTVCQATALPDTTQALVIDALFGTGLSRPLDSHAQAMVEWIAARRADGARVLAIDVPSGLDADTGEPVGDACVRADATVALAAVKPGLWRLAAQPYVGELSVGGIGVPDALLARFGTPWTPPAGLGRLAD